MKLDNKGYMIIEIILASMIAFSIAYFLFDLTLNMKNKSDNMQARAIIMSDRAIIENYIMTQLNNAEEINCGYNTDGSIKRDSEYIQMRLGRNNSVFTFYNDGVEDDPFYFQHIEIDEHGMYGDTLYKKAASDYIVPFHGNSLHCVNKDDSIEVSIEIKDKMSKEDYSIKFTRIK